MQCYPYKTISSNPLELYGELTEYILSMSNLLANQLFVVQVAHRLLGSLWNISTTCFPHRTFPQGRQGRACHNQLDWSPKQHHCKRNCHSSTPQHTQFRQWCSPVLHRWQHKIGGCWSSAHLVVDGSRFAHTYRQPSILGMSSQLGIQ
jgi:hypothetical protein